MDDDSASDDVRDAVETVWPGDPETVLGVDPVIVSTSRGRLDWLARLGPPPAGRIGVVVGDVLPSSVRKALNEAGWSWLDRRGHLRLRRTDDRLVLIDTDVPATVSAAANRSSTDPLSARTALRIAVAAMQDFPAPLPGPSALGRRLGTSQSATSEALQRLIDAGLVTSDRRATEVDTFRAVSARWRLDWVGLATTPDPKRSVLVVTGTRAAAALGAPIAATATGPVEALVADHRALRELKAACGTATLPAAQALVAVAPTSPVVGIIQVGGFPVADPVTVALTLALDPGRGAEVVEAWDVEDRPW